MLFRAYGLGFRAEKLPHLFSHLGSYGWNWTEHEPTPQTFDGLNSARRITSSDLTQMLVIWEKNIPEMIYVGFGLARLEPNNQ